MQLFGQGKSFSRNPFIGNYWLNRCGLHVLRVVVAHGLAHWRWWCLSAFVSSEQRNQYRQQGFILIRNFLPKEHFSALKKEVNTCRQPVRQCIQGDTITRRVLLDVRVLSQLPETRRLLDDKTYCRLLKYGAARNVMPLLYIQSIKNHYLDGRPDPQKTLHSDTFHPTMKAWLFLEDVTETKGPFTFITGSHRLTWARLRWEYRRSLTAARMHDGYSEKGSFRLSEQDRQMMGLPEPQAFAVPENTLIVANTHGFHCRGQSHGKSSRLEIWAYSRLNPFNPLPGFDLGWMRKLEHRVIHHYLNRQDQKAARRHSHSSWHPVPEEKLHE